MTVPLHASICGTVKKIEPRMQANNTEGLCIIIEPAQDEENLNEFMPPLDPYTCSVKDALARVREAGIIGIGGAGFPTHVKLAPPPGKTIEFVIANAAECEPYLTIDERLMAERPTDFVDGMAIVMNIVGAPKGIIGLENNKAHLVPLLESAITKAAAGKDITVQLLATKYPQGGEKMLITAITGREVPSGGLPMDVGCVVSNVGTMRAVSEAFRKGKPVIDTGLTVTGAACESPKNLVVPVGMLAQDLFPDAVRYNAEALKRIVMGGPMMGPAVPSLNVPLQKNTSGLLLMDAKEAKVFSEGPCIRCGRCMKGCACRLSPALLAKALREGDLAEAEAIGVLDCIECGSCSYVCPAHIQLVQRFRIGKQLVRAKKQKEAQRA
ncbi:MAG: electron transport complex subunit RsxC, partial [Spirochaetes bacterium]|nr:electron transport complex subunit RsxC [Spirochaetota bacterium]